MAPRESGVATVNRSSPGMPVQIKTRFPPAVVFHELSEKDTSVPSLSVGVTPDAQGPSSGPRPLFPVGARENSWTVRRGRDGGKSIGRDRRTDTGKSLARAGRGRNPPARLPDPYKSPRKLPGDSGHSLPEWMIPLAASRRARLQWSGTIWRCSPEAKAVIHQKAPCQKKSLISKIPAGR